MIAPFPSQVPHQTNKGMIRLISTSMGMTLGIVMSSTVAQAQAPVQRHPKIDEARGAIATVLPNSLPDILQRETYRTDPRSQNDITTLQSFIDAWNVVSPNTALFLGEWVSESSNGATSRWSIYPSHQSGGRVCVLRQRQQPDSENVDYLFGVGHLVTPSAQAIASAPELTYQLNVTGAGFSTAFQRVTVADIREFTGITAVGKNNNFIDIGNETSSETSSETGNNLEIDMTTTPWQSGPVLAEVAVNPSTDELLLGPLSAFPRLLSEPNFGPPGSAHDTMAATFTSAGCTTNLPPTREWGIQVLPLAETQTLDQTPDISFQFTGAYISDSSTSNSIEAYWTINNQSDRAFALQPLNIRVETADEQPIDCPDTAEKFRDLVGTDDTVGCARGYLDPFQDGFLEPGDSVSGRVVILRHADDLDDLFLVVPDSATGGLEAFRVPIR